MARLNMAKAIYLYNLAKGNALREAGDAEASVAYFTRAQIVTLLKLPAGLRAELDSETRDD